MREFLISFLACSTALVLHWVYFRVNYSVRILWRRLRGKPPELPDFPKVMTEPAGNWPEGKPGGDDDELFPEAMFDEYLNLWAHRMSAHTGLPEPAMIQAVLNILAPMYQLPEGKTLHLKAYLVTAPPLSEAGPFLMRPPNGPQ